MGDIVFNTEVEIVFNIDKVINNIRDSIVNFFPWDFIPRLLLALMGVVFVLGIYRLYEINSNKETANK